MRTTYKNSFHEPVGNLYGPPEYSTDAVPVEYRGWLLYERMRPNKDGHSGCIDAVQDGVCYMQSETLKSAKSRIDKMLDADEAE